MHRRLLLALIALSLFVPAIASAGGDLLTPTGRIGVGGGEGWSGWMRFVAFSRDGRMVASDGPADPHDGSGGLTLWRFPDGRFIKSIAPRPEAISRDWKYYASDREVVDINTGAAVLSLANADEQALPAFSDDGRFIAFTTPNPTNAAQIRVVRIADGSTVNEFGRRAVFALAFDPSGVTLASGHWDNVTLWNAVTGERIALLRGFGRYVDGIGFSVDGRLLAAGTDAGGLQLWSVAKRRRLWSIDSLVGSVSNPAFSPDGTLVAVGVYGTGTVWVIDVRSGAIVGKVRVSGLGCGSVAFSPNGRYLIAPSTGGLVTWPYDQGGTIRVFAVKQRRRRGRARTGEPIAAADAGRAAAQVDNACVLQAAPVERSR
jgi:WD40 repeat protein